MDEHAFPLADMFASRLTLQISASTVVSCQLTKFISQAKSRDKTSWSGNNVIVRRHGYNTTLMVQLISVFVLMITINSFFKKKFAA